MALKDDHHQENRQLRAELKLNKVNYTNANVTVKLRRDGKSLVK